MSFDIAVVAGLIGTVAALLFMQVWEVARPEHRHIRIVALLGSAFTKKAIWQQIAGRVGLFAIGVCYSIFLSAVVYAFELEPMGWLVGLIVGVLLWIFSGISLTYFRLLHPRIRSGEMSAPGPFALGYSRTSAFILLVAHLLFGVFGGTVYGSLAAP